MTIPAVTAFDAPEREVPPTAEMAVVVAIGDVMVLVVGLDSPLPTVEVTVKADSDSSVGEASAVELTGAEVTIVACTDVWV